MLNIIYKFPISKRNVSICIHFSDKKDAFLHFFIKKPLREVGLWRHFLIDRASNCRVISRKALHREDCDTITKITHRKCEFEPVTTIINAF